MKEHLENIRYLYGNCTIRMPNNIFRILSSSIKNKSGKTNSQQIAFSYSYLVTVSFLYKYTHFVDIDHGTYMQNSDIKELLGYSRTTKSIDQVIKRNGILDELELTSTTSNYPIQFNVHETEKIGKIPIRDFTCIQESQNENLNKSYRAIVKNRNYEVKEPLFLTTGFDNSEYGTLYSIERTHAITINELITFLSDEEMDNIDFLIYGFLKSRCKGYENNRRAMAVYKIISEIGIDRSTFYSHLELLKSKTYIGVHHKNWKKKQEDYIEMESNEYFWLGI